MSNAFKYVSGRIKAKTVKGALERITSRLSQEKLRHEIHEFDSGCVMVDIWSGDLFYVIQIEPEMIGLSLVDENTGFDTIPDKAYKEWDNFNADFERILSKDSMYRPV
jgi:hypothetical protein